MKINDHVLSIRCLLGLDGGFSTRVYASAINSGVELTLGSKYHWFAIENENEQLGFISGL